MDLNISEGIEGKVVLITGGSAGLLDFYKQAIPTAPVARSIVFAIEQPLDIDVNAIVLRPTSQQF